MAKKANTKCRVKCGRLEEAPAKRPRGGQPGNANASKANPKSRMISIRLADHELTAATAAAGGQGVRLAEYCRRKILS